MKLEILSLYKHKCRHVEALELEYLKRFKQGFSVELKTVVPKSKTTPADSQKSYTQALPRTPNSLLILLEETGVMLTSTQLAELLREKRMTGPTNLNFAIAGPYGWDQAAKTSADMLISLSKLTFPAHLARLILLEQIYRAYTILEGISYHK